jgi:hypothetical protein
VQRFESAGDSGKTEWDELIPLELSGEIAEFAGTILDQHQKIEYQHTRVLLHAKAECLLGSYRTKELDNRFLKGYFQYIDIGFGAPRSWGNLSPPCEGVGRGAS